MISAASHQLIFFAMAFNKTSCSFIIRSVSAAGYCCEVVNLQNPPPLFQSGQFMCEFNRTDHILATVRGHGHDILRRRANMPVMRLPLALAILALTSCQRNPSPHWVATWATAPVNIPTNFVPEGFLRSAFVNFHFTLKNETARAVVHTTIGGDRVRVHISNRFGTAPLVIGSAHAALRESETAIRAGSDRTLTFSTKPSATIPAGAELVSDAAALSVPALADLAISIYFPNEAAVTTTHVLAVQTSYIAPGDKTDATSLDAAKITSWPFLIGVEVTPVGAASAAVAF